MPVFQINFSRPAGQIVAQYYNFVRLGRDGYRNVHDACYATGKFLAERGGQARALRAALRLEPPDGHSRRWPGASERARTPATRSTTSPTGCAPEAGRCRPTP